MQAGRRQARRIEVSAAAPWLVRGALDVLRQPYPHKLDHLTLHASDRPLPADIHPVFDGCYDWHSSVHMHGSVLRLMRLMRSMGVAADPGSNDAVTAHFDARFTPAAVARELDYAAERGRGSFERPYGWAWLLNLQTELDLQARSGTGLVGAARWAAALRPLARFFASRLGAFLGLGHYPVRGGTHANSAFAMLLALGHADAAGDAALHRAVADAAAAWFAGDVRYPAAYEPGGSDFLSPGLCEALLMKRLLGAGFDAWWRRFEPAPDALRTWLSPARVGDRSDAQFVHLDGLNLSRAWCLGELAEALPALAETFGAASDIHWQAAWPHVMAGDFVATHWLLSFALLSLEAGDLSDTG